MNTTTINECAKCKIVSLLIKTIQDKDKTIKVLNEVVKMKKEAETKDVLFKYTLHYN